MQPITPLNVSRQLELAVSRAQKSAPKRFNGRGIVICAGGSTYFPNAWVCINMLRYMGCKLPIQVWYRGHAEYDERMRIATKKLGVTLVDAYAIKRRSGSKAIGGWELKPFSIIHSPFKEVMYLDADNVPVVNPEFLFETEEFKSNGAIFWPDFGHLQPDDPIWSLCGIQYRDEPEFESGQIVIDKERCWKELQLTWWYNERSDFFYKYVLGDKETFHLAFMKLGTPYAMPNTVVKAIDSTMCQFDFSGKLIFQHRNMDKWRFDGTNKKINGFLEEDRCRSFLAELREIWNSHDQSGYKFNLGKVTTRVEQVRHKLVNNMYIYKRVGYDQRAIAFSNSGTIDIGNAPQERRWHIGQKASSIYLTIFSDDGVTCILKLHDDEVWRGRWRSFERMPIELFPRNKVIVESQTTEDDGKPFLKETTKKICFRAPLNAYTGYGLHTCEVTSFLLKRGFDLTLRATNINETFLPLPDYIRKRISAKEVYPDWELVLHPPGHEPLSDRKTVMFTMWESTRLRSEFVRNLNRAECIIVPTNWNASCFSASGVDRPITVVPLGIQTDIFSYVPMNMEGPCIFGTAGRLESGGVRKGLNQVISLFQKAFPNEANVQLHVKAFPDCSIMAVKDPRIKVTQEFFTAQQLSSWFAGITCFVSAARGEGWGLMQHQSLAVGRPLISVMFGGVAEYFTPDMGYPLNHKLVPSHGLYKDCGVWAEPDENSIIGAMRKVYSDREEARLKGEHAASRVAHLSWEASNSALLKTIGEYGFLS